MEERIAEEKADLGFRTSDLGPLTLDLGLRTSFPLTLLPPGSFV
jgi:hypothetical protein